MSDPEGRSSPAEPVASPKGEACPECDGTTWKRVVKDGIEAVTRCGCFVGERRGSAMAQAGVPLRYRECAFDGRSGGKPIEKFENILPAVKVSERWAEQFPDVDAGLLLSGPPGVGKTHLAVAILRRILVERKIQAPARFVDYRALLREIKSSYHPEATASEREVLRPVLDAEPLVIDDLGGENPTLWVFDTLFYILNQRYNEGKLTIITTNYRDRSGNERDPSLSDRITERLRSRLYEMCRDVVIGGEDYRKIALQANFTR